MAIVEIEEFSTLPKIRDFTENGNLKNLIDAYFDEEPDYEFDHDLNELYISFKKFPFQVTIPNSKSQMSMFFNFHAKMDNSIIILNRVSNGALIDDVISNLGKPDFERGPVGGNMECDYNSMIKYYVDQYSVAIDHRDGCVLSASVFEDEFR